MVVNRHVFHGQHGFVTVLIGVDHLSTRRITTYLLRLIFHDYPTNRVITQYPNLIKRSHRGNTFYVNPNKHRFRHAVVVRSIELIVHVNRILITSLSDTRLNRTHHPIRQSMILLVHTRTNKGNTYYTIRRRLFHTNNIHALLRHSL